MDNEVILALLNEYASRFEGILARFERDSGGLYMLSSDEPLYRQWVHELIDLFNDCLGRNHYSIQIAKEFNEGIAIFTDTPSFSGVENILSILRAAITRFSRNPEILSRKKAAQNLVRRENVFVIHGRDEAKWRELKDILQNQFRLSPLILQELPNAGCKTVIEKFEHYAESSSFAIAVFTPDDEVTANRESYLQARPNVIYELGWFCGRLGRKGAMLLLKEGTSLFSDFGGIIQLRFISNISERIAEMQRELVAAGIIDEV
jgi:predicted nucleotide-binding protein